MPAIKQSKQREAIMAFLKTSLQKASNIAQAAAFSLSLFIKNLSLLMVYYFAFFSLYINKTF